MNQHEKTVRYPEATIVYAAIKQARDYGKEYDFMQCLTERLWEGYPVRTAVRESLDYCDALEPIND